MSTQRFGDPTPADPMPGVFDDQTTPRDQRFGDIPRPRTPRDQRFGDIPRPRTPGFLNNDDLIREIFGADPELAFLEQVGGQGLSQNMQEFFRGQTGNFLRQFNQNLAQQLGQGRLPGINAGRNFFGGLNLREEFGKFSPQQRGLGISRFNPQTRFFF